MFADTFHLVHEKFARRVFAPYRVEVCDTLPEGVSSKSLQVNGVDVLVFHCWGCAVRAAFDACSLERMLAGKSSVPLEKWALPRSQVEAKRRVA